VGDGYELCSLKSPTKKPKNRQIRRPRWPRNAPLPEQDVFRKQIVDGVLCNSGSRPIALKTHVFFDLVETK